MDLALAAALLAIGVLLGVLALLAAETLLAYKFILRPLLFGADSCRVNNGPERVIKDDGVESPQDDDFAHWPAGIVRELRQALTPAERRGTSMTGATSSIHHGHTANLWINACVQRLFVECRQSPALRQRLTNSVLDKLTRRMRGSEATLDGQTSTTAGVAGLITAIDITDLDLGENPPVLENVHLDQSEHAAERLDVILEFDIRYSGGFRITIVTNLNIGIKIPVSVKLGGFVGKMQLRIPSPSARNQYAIAFLEDPGISFDVQSSFVRKENAILKDVLNSFIARRLRTLVLDLFVLPNWRSFDLPLVNLRPGERAGTSTRPVAIKAHNTNQSTSPVANTGPSHPTPNGSKKASTEPDSLPTSASVASLYTRWRPASSILHDVLSDKCFPVTSIVTSSNIELYHDQLIRCTLKLLNERSTSANGVANAYAATSGAMDSADTQRDMWLSSNWETTRNKRGVQTEKKRVVVGTSKAEVYRATFTIDHFTAFEAFQVLSNFEHNRHVEDSYIESSVVERFDDARCLRRVVFRVARQTFEFLLVEIKQRVTTVTGRESWLVVFRSVKAPTTTAGSPTNATGPPSTNRTPESTLAQPRRPISPSQLPQRARAESGLVVQEVAGVLLSGAARSTVSPTSVSTAAAGASVPTSGELPAPIPSDAMPGTLYLLAYQITDMGGGRCSVKIVSQFGSVAIQKLDVSWNRCLRIKAFVEELAEWTHLTKAGAEATGTQNADMTARRNSGSTLLRSYLSANIRRASQFIRSNSGFSRATTSAQATSTMTTSLSSGALDTAAAVKAADATHSADDSSPASAAVVHVLEDDSPPSSPVPLPPVRHGFVATSSTESIGAVPLFSGRGRSATIDSGTRRRLNVRRVSFDSVFTRTSFSKNLYEDTLSDGEQ